MRFLIIAVLVCLAVDLGATETSSTGARPNVVFIIVDDLRWDALGCSGHPLVKTPNIDRLADEGALFTNAFVTIPLCSPSRASFLTGKYSHANGIVDNRGENTGHDLITFPKLLHDVGYETAFVGKWHMGNDDTPRLGFDYWACLKGQGTYKDPTLNINGKVERQSGYVTDILTSRAVEFLRQPRTAPFVLYVGHKAVHGPFTPADRHRGLYSSGTIARRPNCDDTLADKPALRIRTAQHGNKAIIGRRKANANGRNEELIRNQLRCMASVDEGVGDILGELERMKLLDQTLVIFTSDNGYFWGEHRLGDKRSAHEEGIRVPLVMRLPKVIKAGLRPGEMVLNVDIAPTLLELGGAKPPDGLHGRSLIPLFGIDRSAWRTSALFEYFWEPGFARIPAWEAVRTDRYKFITYSGLPDADELYDLKSDPLEMKNLAREDPNTADALRRELQRLRDQSGPVNCQPNNRDLQTTSTQ